MLVPSHHNGQASLGQQFGAAPRAQWPHSERNVQVPIRVQNLLPKVKAYFLLNDRTRVTMFQISSGLARSPSPVISPLPFWMM